MWIHIVIFMIILGFLLACRAGWIQAEPLGGRYSLRLFVAVAACGNILGMAFTMTGGSPAVYDDGLRIEKGSGGIHEEEFQVAASGEEMETVMIQVPEKETEEEEAPAETEEAEEESRERRIREMVEEYNSQKQDPDYYYLPARWEGETFTWRRPGDPSGALLASMGLFAAFVVLMKKSREAQEREMKRSEQLLMDYPALVMKFALLIQAGMTAGRAFRKIAGDYRRRNPDGGRSAYDAVAAAKARKADVLLCDTAGRLHNKKNLMEELKKINRVIDREYPEAFRETLVVLDATTGQNALAQAREFNEAADITGVILTKMDGTAKGGIAVAIQAELGIPVKFIGVGESIDDLQKFDPDEFVNALFYREED